MNKYALLITGILLSGTAQSSSEDGVKIVNLNINRELGQVFVRTSKDPVADGCHTDLAWNYTFLLSTDGDMAVYSTLLAAKMAGSNINLVGYGSCPEAGYQKVEELRWATITN